MAEISRTSTASIYTRTISDFTQKQAGLAKIQDQISSGFRESTFTGYGNDIGRVVELEASIKVTERYQRGNQLVIGRLEAMDGAVSQLQTIAQEFRNTLLNKRSGVGASVNLLEFTDSAFEQVADSLNTKFLNRFLFSGSKTNMPAIPSNALDETNMVSGADGQRIPSASYYGGDSLVYSVKASNEVSLNYGITGDHPAFQQLIAAMHEAQRAEEYAFNSSASVEAVESAVDLVNQALSELSNIQASVNSDRVRIEALNNQHSRVLVEFKSAFTEIAQTDVVEASIQSSLTQASLEAVMQTFARISNLSLVDFLR